MDVTQSAVTISSNKKSKYEELREKYANGIPCPADYSFVTHAVDKWAAQDPNLLALHWASADFKQERKITFAEFSVLSHRAAHVFAGLGITKGDRVMMQLPRIVDWWICVFGLMRLGAVPVPGTLLLVAKDLRFRAATSGAVAFIGVDDSCRKFEEIAKEVGVSKVVQILCEDGDRLGAGRVDFRAELEKISDNKRWTSTRHSPKDLAIIYFTSGTTGNPKMVLLEQEYCLAHTISGHWYRMSPGKMFLNMGDLGWGKASYWTFGAWNHGATIFVQPSPPGAFDPTHLLESLHRYPVTNLCCPPTIYRSLLSTKLKNYFKAHPPLALEHCNSAGEPLNGAVIKQFHELSGVQIHDGWGQSETAIVVGNFEGFPIREGSMGRVAPGVEVAPLGPDGEVAIGEEGELGVRTDALNGERWIFRGYFKDGVLDTRRKKFADGKTWYLTGDKGFKDKDGYFWFVGRADDVIKSAGYRIGPFEIESALKEHESVQESAAVASPDLKRGQIVKAFIVLTDEYQKKVDTSGPEFQRKLIKELQSHCQKSAAPYKYPRAVEFVPELPKNVSGKILRVELRNAEYKKHADIAEALKSKL